MMQWIKDRLIDDWRVFHKRWSFQLQGLVFAMNGLYAVWPAFASLLDPITLAFISMALAIAIGVAGIIKQPKLHKKKGKHHG